MMTDAEVERFVTGRYAELLKFYDEKAARNKKAFYGCSIYVILSSAALGPLTAIDWPYARTLTVMLAPTVTIVAGILTLYQAQQNWLGYRSAWDALKREDSWWRARVDDYASGDANALFVKRVEAIAASEGRGWYMRQGERTSRSAEVASSDSEKSRP